MLRYSTALFERPTMERMSGHLRTLLEGIIANPNGSVRALPMLTEAERHEILVGCNPLRAASVDKCVHELFEEQVARTPEAPAISFANQTMTYRELNDRANALGRRLRLAGVGPRGWPACISNARLRCSSRSWPF